MRIAIIVYVFPPEHAPAGVMVHELAEDLAARGHQVTVQTGWPNHPGGKLFPGWRVKWRCLSRDGRYRLMRVWHSITPKSSTLGRLWGYLTFAVSSLVNGLAAGPVDAVLSLSTPVFGGWSAWVLARLKGARFVYDVFDLHPEGARSAGLLGEGLAYRLWRWGDTALMRRADAIATLGPGIKRLIEARGIDGAKVTVVPFWLDTDRIRPSDRANAWRRAQGIPAETFVALYAGTIGYISGAQVLVETAERLRDRPDILLLVVGEGVAKDELEAEARRRGLGNIRFLPFQPEEVLSQVQATADVGLVTLLPEAGKSSIPSKVLGYMAAGRPVVASVAEDSDTAEMIRAGGCGWVVPPQDGAVLTDAIREAADHPDQTRRRGERARQHMLAHFARTRAVASYECLLAGAR
ncbi:MAG: glycosyltransferase family 4 protein [Phycisphaerae bacterium]